MSSIVNNKYKTMTEQDNGANIAGNKKRLDANQLDQIIWNMAGNKDEEDPCIIDGFYIMVDWSDLGSFYVFRVKEVKEIDGKTNVILYDENSSGPCNSHSAAKFILGKREFIEVDDSCDYLVYLEEYNDLNISPDVEESSKIHEQDSHQQPCII